MQGLNNQLWLFNEIQCSVICRITDHCYDAISKQKWEMLTGKTVNYAVVSLHTCWGRCHRSACEACLLECLGPSDTPGTSLSWAQQLELLLSGHGGQPTIGKWQNMNEDNLRLHLSTNKHTRLQELFELEVLKKKDLKDSIYIPWIISSEILR